MSRAVTFGVAMTREEQIDLRTQELVKLQLGELVLTLARQRAELEVLRAEPAAMKAEAPRDAP